MCGRFSLHLTDLSRLAESLHVSRSGVEVWEPRYNVAPSQLAPVVTGERERRMVLMAWGLVPHFAKGAPRTRPINARAETVAQRPMFREAFKSRRCIVPATGYFEWRVGEDGRKQPFWIHPEAKDGLLYMAGIWAPPSESSGEQETFAVLTTDAQGAVRDVHDRMPLSLSLEDSECWLTGGSAPAGLLETVLNHATVEGLELRPVSTLVNAPRNDAPECISPAPHPTEDRPVPKAQLDLFASGDRPRRR